MLRTGFHYLQALPSDIGGNKEESGVGSAKLSLYFHKLSMHGMNKKLDTLQFIGDGDFGYGFLMIKGNLNLW